MTRVVIIGIDGMDTALIEKYKDELPNISRLQASSPRLGYTSVFPPDTPTAWASIFTGMNPAQHGVLFFVDPLERVGVTSFKDLDNDAVRKKTFWDIAGKSGKSTCILFPELGFPVWDVNGVMVSKSKERYGEVPLIDAYPPEYFGGRDLSGLAAIRSVSKKNTLHRYLDAYRKLIRSEAEFSLEMYKKEDWDLFFTYSCGLDWIGHSLWNHFDEEDPSYIPGSQFGNVLREFYVHYDAMIGSFLDELKEDTVLILLSDHGFGRRPTKLLNINKILKDKGFLTKKTGSASKKQFFIEFTKQNAISYVNYFGAGNTLMRLFVFFPHIKKMLTTPSIINWDQTIAYVSDLSGIKSYQYGGINIKKEMLDEEQYEEIRKRLIEDLQPITDPATGKRVFEWICRREDYYRGEFDNKYPDIIFHMTYDYGAGWALEGDLISECKTHNIQPGSHRIDTPVLLMKNVDSKSVVRHDAELTDIAPTVLHLLGIATENLNMYGNSLVK